MRKNELNEYREWRRVGMGWKTLPVTADARKMRQGEAEGRRETMAREMDVNEAGLVERSFSKGRASESRLCAKLS